MLLGSMLLSLAKNKLPLPASVDSSLILKNRRKTGFSMLK